MTDRYTKSMVEYRFLRLCKALDKRPATDYNDKGAWALDYAGSYGGYRIIEYSETGGESSPFGNRRWKTREMVEMIDFALDAIAFKNGERV